MNELNTLVNKFGVISKDTGEKIKSMLDVFSDDTDENPDPQNPENVIANLLGGPPSNCLNDTKILIESLLVLGSRLNNLKTILVDVMGMRENSFKHEFPLSIVSAMDGEDVVYKLKTVPIDLEFAGSFVKYKYNIPLIMNTKTGIDYRSVIQPINSAENSQSIVDVTECLRFLSNNLNEVCQLLLGQSNS